MMRRLTILASLAVAVFLTLAVLALVVIDRFDGLGPLQADTVFFIEPGTTMGSIKKTETALTAPWRRH